MSGQAGSNAFIKPFAAPAGFSNITYSSPQNSNLMNMAMQMVVDQNPGAFQQQPVQQYPAYVPLSFNYKQPTARQGLLNNVTMYRLPPSSRVQIGSKGEAK